MVERDGAMVREETHSLIECSMSPCERNKFHGSGPKDIHRGFANERNFDEIQTREEERNCDAPKN